MVPDRRLGAALFVLSLAVSGAVPASAQLVTPSASPNGGSSDQADTAVTSFMGLEVKVKRIVADPSVKGYRVIIGLRNTEETTRLAALMAPAPTIVDDMGNLYQISALAGGMGVCDQFKRVKPSDCRYYAADAFTRLPSSVEIVTTLIFAPVEGRVLEDTLSSVETGSLQARFAFLEEGGQYQDTQANDIVINDLELP